ncbi:fibronectin type III domain-containing protein [Robertkochia flava]|uniref:fibronectin type III domain-containing protein n=1 Tax=Robertkochia flava TaxID=3447986 RepID=UPI001CCCA9A7|nr:fibronectin type III domain-containing protein [Robertkochia marina]
MKYQNIISILNKSFPVIALSALLSCGGGDSENPKPEPVPDPVAAVLTFPANNEVCYDGNVISPTLSEVTFSWQPAEHTDSYELKVTDLNTNTVKTYPVSATQTTVSLERATPYSWEVTSLAGNTNAEATSATWKFYLAGEGITTYAPFPATLEFPASGSSLNTTKVNFEWSGSDADSQALSYQLFLDSVDGKSEMIADTGSSENYEVNDLTPGTEYFWSVATTDTEGNTSRSQVYVFKTE